MPMGLSERQMEAHAFFTQMLTQDAYPQDACAPIDWARDEPEVTKHLYAMFFKGLLRRSGRVRYAVKPDRLGRANLHFGLTEYEGDGGTVNPSFETQESDVAGVHTRIQKRSRALGVLCHEMVHALFDVYGCHCAASCRRRGGDWALLIDLYEHSDAWTSVALRVNRLFIGPFEGLLDFVRGVQASFVRRGEPFFDALRRTRRPWGQQRRQGSGRRRGLWTVRKVVNLISK
ncbi:hypothetical protein PG995_010521 [Apiospora arundinis]